MTVSLGPKRLLGANTLLGTSQFLGQGNTGTAKDIEWEVLFSTDDASVAVPSWTYIQDKLRAFSVSRGRASELSDVDAGTAQLTLDNRDRRFDPLYTSGPFYPNLSPMNRVWLRLRFNGDTLDVFKGWVERYEQQYPGTVDAVTLVSAVDEFKVLAQLSQPTSDPPRDSYADVIQFDQPAGYWRFSDDPASLAERAEIGPDFVSSAFSAVTDGGITGDNPAPYAAARISGSQSMNTTNLASGEVSEFGGLSAMSVEFWLKADAEDVGTLLQGPFGGVTQEWFFSCSAAVGVVFAINNNVVTGFTAAAHGPVTDWTHVCGTLSGGTMTLYFNGVVAATNGTFTGTINNQANNPMWVSNTAAKTNPFNIDELAIYRYALPAARVLAHYQAGAQRGYPRGQLAGERIGDVLDAASSHAPRNLLTGTRPLAGQWTGNGANTLETLRDVENAEAVDAVLFIASDGTITFLDGGYRSTSPWNTVQATFGDAGGAELDFMDIAVDFSDSFIANKWNVTRDGGTTQTTSDTTSQDRYLTRSQSLTDLKLRDDSDAADVAADMLAKYKDPLTRVLSIKPKTMDVNVIDAVFRLELGDRITVKLTPPGGGSRFDQTLFVQSIAIDATPQAVFPAVTLGVSPV